MKYRVPIAIVMRGEIEVEADGLGDARLKARRVLAQSKETYRMLLEHGAGTMQIGRNITKVETNPMHTFKDGRFIEEDD